MIGTSRIEPLRDVGYERTAMPLAFAGPLGMVPNADWRVQVVAQGTVGTSMAQSCASVSYGPLQDLADLIGRARSLSRR